MSFDALQSLNDLQRQIANLLRVGTIAEVDHGAMPPLVRVQLSATVRTDWRPYFELRAGNTGTWNPPTVGEAVMVLSPGGLTEAGFVLGGLPTVAHPPPSSDPNKTVTLYPDGARFEYDHATHALAITLPDGGTADVTVPDSITVQCKTADVTASDSATVHSQQITLDAPDTIATGNVIVQGLLTWQAGMVGYGIGPSGQGAQINCDMQLINGHSLTTDAGDVVAGGISLQHHRHGQVQEGTATSGGPVA